jgi:hypothetical protein
MLRLRRTDRFCVVFYLLIFADRRRVDAAGTYKNRKFAEVGDNPLYRYVDMRMRVPVVEDLV